MKDIIKKHLKKKKDSNTAKTTFVVANDKGLHTRPSTELVKCASNFKSKISLSFQGIIVDAKSLLGILSLAASKGSKLKLEAKGEDAQQAIDAILTLAKQKFKLEY